MRVYLAARWARRVEIAAIADDFRQRGHRVTSRWLSETIDAFRLPGEDAALPGTESLADIAAADAVVLFTEDRAQALPENGGGRHFELGFAYALDKLLFIVGPRENVFHFLPRVAVYASYGDLLCALDDERRAVATPGKPVPAGGDRGAEASAPAPLNAEGRKTTA